MGLRGVPGNRSPTGPDSGPVNTVLTSATMVPCGKERSSRTPAGKKEAHCDGQEGAPGGKVLKEEGDRNERALRTGKSLG